MFVCRYAVKVGGRSQLTLDLEYEIVQTSESLAPFLIADFDPL